MAELDISQEQFLDAFDKAQTDPKHKKIVHQVMAVEDFLIFKQLMIKRNTELNQEALKMMLEKEKQQLKLIQKA
jgi:The ARF-like 2 binding protein BART